MRMRSYLIGARNTESQVHRELASGMSMPIGFKNATDGSIKPAADSCFAAAFEHHFLSINLDGRVISAETKGNPDCHLVLRGSSHGPNCDAASVAQALVDLKGSKASGPSEHGLIIDIAQIAIIFLFLDAHRDLKLSLRIHFLFFTLIDRKSVV